MSDGEVDRARIGGQAVGEAIWPAMFVASANGPAGGVVLIGWALWAYRRRLERARIDLAIRCREARRVREGFYDSRLQE